MKLYVIVGEFRERQRYSDDVIGPWPVCWRGELAEAERVVNALIKQAEEFSAWKLKMQLNNSAEDYQDRIEQYIEKHMLDKAFIEGAEYSVWGVEEDPTEVVV